MLPIRRTVAPIRVLVIDDDPLVGNILLRALVPTFDVDVEEDPLQALATLLDDPKYDVVLSDVQMPAVSGPEILSVLRRAHSPVAGRFVFMTAANVSDFPGCAQTFGRPILRKPVSIMELVRVLRTVARGEGALEAQSAITS